MFIQYPARNFKCPFCGEKMPTQEYKAWQPWNCPGCSAKLQFSEAYGWVVQLCFLGMALLLLYLLGLRGWQLAVVGVLAGSLLTLVLIGPLHRIMPPSLEAYRPPAWRRDNPSISKVRHGSAESNQPQHSDDANDKQQTFD
jgi:hypothetical protein